MKAKRFFFHYNKPASQKAGRPVISIHHNKSCILVDNIVCQVRTQGKIRTKQPCFVMCGKANEIEIRDNVAYIS